ncbi:2-oxoglutarate and iron-dependent oxygenase domain-containing protein 2-like isoform X2 [Ciona intestinalis]
MILLDRGASDEDVAGVLLTLRRERERRENLGGKITDRTLQVSQQYVKLHPYLYKIKDEFFSPKFLEIVEYSKSDEANQSKLISMLSKTKCDHVWSLPVFTDKFCDDFVEEITNFEKSICEKGRPNTMNNYGILLNELGFDELFFNEFRRKYISPVVKILYPEWFGLGLDSHKVFTVKYKHGEDLGLAYHYDNAEVTLNVCLGKQFEGGELYFGGMRTEPIDLLHTKPVLHNKSYGILHRGQHLHGAMGIDGTSERHNIIMWMRSSSVRNKLCPMCDDEPQLVVQSGFGDGFTQDGPRFCALT